MGPRLWWTVVVVLLIASLALGKKKKCPFIKRYINKQLESTLQHQIGDSECSIVEHRRFEHRSFDGTYDCHFHKLFVEGSADQATLQSEPLSSKATSCREQLFSRFYTVRLQTGSKLYHGSMAGDGYWWKQRDNWNGRSYMFFSSRVDLGFVYRHRIEYIVTKPIDVLFINNFTDLRLDSGIEIKRVIDDQHRLVGHASCSECEIALASTVCSSSLRPVRAWLLPRHHSGDWMGVYNGTFDAEWNFNIDEEGDNDSRGHWELEKGAEVAHQVKGEGYPGQRKGCRIEQLKDTRGSSQGVATADGVAMNSFVSGSLASQGYAMVCDDEDNGWETYHSSQFPGQKFYVHKDSGRRTWDPSTDSGDDDPRLELEVLEAFL